MVAVRMGYCRELGTVLWGWEHSKVEKGTNFHYSIFVPGFITVLEEKMLALYFP